MRGLRVSEQSERKNDETKEKEKEKEKEMGGAQTNTFFAPASLARSCKGDREQKKALNAINFDWGDDSRFIKTEGGFAKVLSGLYAYNKIRGDLCVDENFLIPAYDPWPENLANFKLGKAVFKLRPQWEMIQEEHPLKWVMLNQLGFWWF